MGRRIVTLAVLLLATSIALGGPDAPPKLDALLDRISFNCAEKPETLGKELAGLSQGDLARLCGMLVEPGTGDDTKARMALQGLTLYLGGGGTPDQRDAYLDVLRDALAAGRPVAVKRFLIQQLQLVGSERSVTTLAGFLHDEELCDPAAQALAAIGADSAIEALVAGAKDAPSAARAAIFAAVRSSENAAALRRLVDQAQLPQASADDPKLAFDVRGATAMRDAAAAARELHDALRKHAWPEGQQSETRWAKAQAMAYALEVADSLKDTPNQELAVLLYRDLLELCNAPEEAHVRCAALHGLASTLGAQAVGNVMAALTGEDAELRAAAIEIAIRLPGADVTKGLTEQTENASATTRADILSVLAQRGDASALPAVLGALKDDDKDVQIAAAKAAAKLGRENAVDALVAFLATAGTDGAKAAEDAMTGMPGDAAAERIAAALSSAAPPAQAALLNVLARRRARGQLKAVLKLINDKNEAVQIAAVNAVGVLAGEAAAPPLLSLLKSTESEPARAAIETALAAVCNRAQDPESRAAPIIAAIDMDTTRDYCSLLRVLGHIGGKPTVRTFRDAIADPRDEVKETAIRALADWPNPTILDTAFVLTVAHDAKELKNHVLAMRAFAEFLGRTGGERIDITVGLFRAGMEAARRDEEKKLLLSKLANIHDLQVLDILVGYLGNETLRDEAAAATITVAEALLPNYWSPARDALNKVLAAVQTESVRSRAQEVLKQVAEYEDFITDWFVSGPYTEGDKGGAALFDVVFPPEQPDAENVAWKRQPLSPSAEYWRIDLMHSLGGDQRVAYLRTYVWSPTAQDVLLELGSDDGIKAWLNGELIHANNALRGCTRGEDRVKTALREGWNTLLLKVCNVGGAWGACARFRTPDGGRVEGLKFDANAKP